MDEKGSKKDIKKCPWCGVETEPRTSLLRKQYGSVRERRCTNCSKVLAAYLEEEGEFMTNIRTF
jgi:phage FluMu protein Com